MVFSRKTNADGDTIRYKAHMDVRGFIQGYVEHTYAPVVDFSTVRLFLSLAVQRGHAIHQIDIKPDFLYGDLEEIVYGLPPEGLNLFKSLEFLNLLKSLYGFRKAPR